jgi:ribosomal protein S12 methylthiotransferase
VSQRVHFVTLGCPKNQVDSEVMLGVLARAGHEMVADPEGADVLVVNTCAFIGPAKEESVDTILDLARVKAAGEGRRLVVTGCLAQRYADDLRSSMPEVDVFVGTGDLLQIAQAVDGPPANQPTVYRGAMHVLPPHALAPRVRTGNWWTSYLKISEGCDHECSFCIIPKIRGPHESRGLVDLVNEAASLADSGVVELNLIAQDLTAYGHDLPDGTTLARLLNALATRVPDLRWLRLLYAYPSTVTEELLAVMADQPSVCRYLDMPLQHISDRMLRAMRRGGTSGSVRRLVDRIRTAVPGIAIRTTFIAGFPGETDADVDELCAFLEEAQFENVGVFQYSREENTTANDLPGQVSARTKEARWKRLMATQAGVAARHAAAQVGRVVEVLVDGVDDAGQLVGRTAQQAPEIDGTVQLVGGEAEPGDLVKVRVLSADTYDLTGAILTTAVDRERANP